MERYSEYKDSGVKWLGEIPSQWEVKRLGSFFTERRVKVSDEDYEPLSVAKLGVFPQWENVAKTNDGDNRKLVKKGDFVINSRSDRKGSSGISDRDGSVSLINIVLEPRKTIKAGYTNYLLKSYKFIDEYYRNGRGIVADLWTTRFEEMKMIKLAVPTIEEQLAIASYLDSVTSKIDRAIAQQQRMIELLNERKQIIINDAVTKGLDPNVPMKDSGVEWIGMIPEHWEVRRFKTMMSIQRGHDLTSENFKDGKIPVYGSGGLMGYHNTITSKSPSIVIGRSGSVGKLHYIEEDYWAHNTAIYLTDNKGNNVKYLYFLLSSIDLSSLATQTAVPTLDRKNVLNYCVPVTIDYSEQNKIVWYIEKKIRSLDVVISNINHQISLLQERKQIIINDVVTGKVKVV